MTKLSREISLILFVYYLILSAAAYLWFWYSGNAHQSLSFILGAVLSGILFFLSYCGWKGIFEKKFVALSASVIVFKYAILVFFVYFLTQLSWISIGWLIAGIGAFKLPLFLIAYQSTKE